jgi:hypothetical protein
MSPESYNERLKDSKDPAGLRLKMVLLRRTGPPPADKCAFVWSTRAMSA